MANRIKQFRYYTEGSTENYPNKIRDNLITPIDYINGSVFSDYYPISQLGIQTLPGTKFYLNNALEEIIIGSTGIYELELNDQTEITKIQINAESMALINDNNNAFLLVDIIYDDGEE